MTQEKSAQNVDKIFVCVCGKERESLRKREKTGIFHIAFHSCLCHQR